MFASALPPEGGTPNLHPLLNLGLSLPRQANAVEGRYTGFGAPPQVVGSQMRTASHPVITT